MGRYYLSRLSSGIGSSIQLSLENFKYRIKVVELNNEITIVKENLSNFRFESLTLKVGIKELEKAKVKFKKEDVIFVAKAVDNQLVWLEKGNDSVGLKHIIKRHTNDFKNYLGIDEKDIPNKINEIVTTWQLVSKKLKLLNGREGYEYIFEKEGLTTTLVALGTNGFIVSVYPKKEKKWKK